MSYIAMNEVTKFTLCVMSHDPRPTTMGKPINYLVL